MIGVVRKAYARALKASAVRTLNLGREVNRLGIKAFGPNTDPSRKAEALWRTSDAIYSVSDLFWSRLQGSHTLSSLVGVIDNECGEKAPGWWDVTIDCGGHNCRECDECKIAQVMSDKRVDYATAFGYLDDEGYLGDGEHADVPIHKVTATMQARMDAAAYPGGSLSN